MPPGPQDAHGPWGFTFGNIQDQFSSVLYWKSKGKKKRRKMKKATMVPWELAQNVETCWFHPCCQLISHPNYQQLLCSMLILLICCIFCEMFLSHSHVTSNLQLFSSLTTASFRHTPSLQHSSRKPCHRKGGQILFSYWQPLTFV